jgi:hypothetical protein
VKKYAKAIVALIGTTVTFLLGVVPQGTPTWTILTGVAALLTVLGVHQTPNAGGSPEPEGDNPTAG